MFVFWVDLNAKGGGEELGEVEGGETIYYARKSIFNTKKNKK